MVAP
jgi:hypothetical protein